MFITARIIASLDEKEFQRKSERDDLVMLMTAYKNSISNDLKKETLSLYSFRHPAETLQAIHLPYGNLSNWKIKQASSHAKIHGPGTVPVGKVTAYEPEGPSGRRLYPVSVALSD